MLYTGRDVHFGIPSVSLSLASRTDRPSVRRDASLFQKASHNENRYVTLMYTVAAVRASVNVATQAADERLSGVRSETKSGKRVAAMKRPYSDE
jgi:hypothetical protein